MNAEQEAWDSCRRAILRGYGVPVNRIEPDVRPVYDMTMEEQVRKYGMAELDAEYEDREPDMRDMIGKPIEYKDIVFKGMPAKQNQHGDIFLHDENGNCIECIGTWRQDSYVSPKEQAEAELYFEVTGRPRSRGTLPDFYPTWGYAEWYEEYQATGQSYAFDKMMSYVEPHTQYKPAITKTVKKYRLQDRVCDAVPVLIIVAGIVLGLLIIMVL